jgi:DNA-binding CsgD family transcriptional regulator
MCRLRAGALAEAEAESRRALAVLAGQPWADRVPALSLQTDALVAQGRLQEAAAVHAGADAHPARQGLVGAAALECRGRLRIALGETQPGLDALVLAGLEADRCGILSPALTSWRAEAAPVLASLGLGDQARTLASANLDMARAFGSLRPLGLALRAAGLVAEPADRTDLLYQSVAVLERSPARYDLARSLVDLGGALRTSGDPARAREVLRRGAHVASVCRAAEVVAAAQRELRAAGGRPRRLAVTGADALTPAELRVARMAGAGRTNAAIAAELGVTAKTVERHLARAYQKLQIEGRSQIGPALTIGDPAQS